MINVTMPVRVRGAGATGLTVAVNVTLADAEDWRTN
jgi:hypothetical protein